MSNKKMQAKKVSGKVRISKKDRKNITGQTGWALLIAEQKRDSKSSKTTAAFIQK